MATPENTSAEAEHKNHRYVGTDIPWYVHVLWISFWAFAIVYILSFLFPAIQRELVSPP
jgi:hypothetical protein